jgi:hypothetical protein
MKVGSKRRRTRQEIDDEKMEDLAKKEDLDAKLK